MQIRIATISVSFVALASATPIRKHVSLTTSDEAKTAITYTYFSELGTVDFDLSNSTMPWKTPSASLSSDATVSLHAQATADVQCRTKSPILFDHIDNEGLPRCWTHCMCKEGLWFLFHDITKLTMAEFCSRGAIRELRTDYLYRHVGPCVQWQCAHDKAPPAETNRGFPSLVQTPLRLLILEWWGYIIHPWVAEWLSVGNRWVNSAAYGYSAAIQGRPRGWEFGFGQGLMRRFGRSVWEKCWTVWIASIEAKPGLKSRRWAEARIENLCLHKKMTPMLRDFLYKGIGGGWSVKPPSPRQAS